MLIDGERVDTDDDWNGGGGRDNIDEQIAINTNIHQVHSHVHCTLYINAYTKCTKIIHMTWLWWF